MRFDETLDSYEKYAQVQEKVAQNLLEFFKKNTVKREFYSILELGCGTGLFTEKYSKFLKYNTLILNDLFNSEKHLKKINYTNFLEGDMGNLRIPSSDLILSSSAFQWIENLEELLEKVSTAETLCFSIYLKGNLIEIKNHFNISLNYKNANDLIKILSKFYRSIEYCEESILDSYHTPIDALKSLKYTGVTGAFGKVSPGLIKSFASSSLTYNVGYFVCQR